MISVIYNNYILQQNTGIHYSLVKIAEYIRDIYAIYQLFQNEQTHAYDISVSPDIILNLCILLHDSLGLGILTGGSTKPFRNHHKNISKQTNKETIVTIKCIRYKYNTQTKGLYVYILQIKSKQTSFVTLFLYILHDGGSCYKNQIY